jgi:hypothetical protein
MASTELLPDGAELWRAKGASLQIRSPVPGVLHASYTGNVPEDLAVPYNAFLQRCLEQAPRVVVFVDAGELTNYETGFRVRTVQAHKAAGDRIECVHVFLRSKIAQLGVAAANLVLGNMVAYSAREQFATALSKATVERVRR